jgi:hypothetical protein
MKLVALVMFFVLAVAASCSSPPVESMPVTMNTLESVESKQVMYDGEPWIEVAIGLAAFLLES